MNISYKQKVKQTVRHRMIRRAVELLTQERSTLCCVRRNYVRDIFDYFTELDESIEKREANQIEEIYIQMWENIQAQYVGNKRVEEITVCYLAGPEPENDFKEFISLGVLPHNIWAFESEKNTYLQALKSLNSNSFFQPKLVKTSIEKYFENTPKEFDIVYMDACSSLISEQHTLRAIATMFRYHRLASPGILITNFAEIDMSNSQLLEEYYDMLTKYNVIKRYPDCTLVQNKGGIQFAKYYDEILDLVKNDFQGYYGNFITTILCNTGAITTPTLRFVNSSYLQNLSNIKPNNNILYNYKDVNTIKNNTFYKFLAINEFLFQNNSSDLGIKRIRKLAQELSADWKGYTLLESFHKLYEIREYQNDVNENIRETLKYFQSSGDLYQFLDKPTPKLFLDAVINQMSCPMHYCTDKIERLSYTAKETRMYMDMIPFDECRYIYDWLPSIDQMKNAFSNKSWQYVFRFALDGLVKKRINYNNEYFFQGTVVTQKLQAFKADVIKKREVMHEGE